MSLPSLAPIDRAAARAFLDAPPTRDDVVQAYRWIVGRDPRSAEEIDGLLARHGSRRDFRAWLIATKGSLHAQLISRFGDEKWVMTEIFDGYRIWLNLCDRHVSMGALVGTWEAEETAFVRRMLKAGDVVVDVGANIGWFTLVARGCVGPTGRVHAFEPQQRIFKYLARTIDENRMLGEVLPYRIALADTWGTCDLTWNPTSANMGHAWLARDGDAGGLGSVTTGVLDDIIGDGRVDFMKVDAEGAEALVLAGAGRILRRCRPTVLMEVVPKFLERVSGTGPEAIFESFAAAGYVAHEVTPSGPGPQIAAWPKEQSTMNLCFLSTDR